MRGRRGGNTLERKVYFYRLIAGTSLPRPAFDPILAARLIDQLSFADGKRYLDIENGNALCVWPVQTTGNVKLQLGIVRRTSLPDVEENGNITPLGISDRQGLVEIIHIIFFPNNIVGAEFNFYGPRISRLPGYLHTKFGTQLPPIQLAILLRQDAQAQLAHIQTIRVGHIRLHRSNFALLQEANDSLPQVFRTAANIAGADIVEIIFRPERYSRHHLGSDVLNLFKRLVGISEIRQGAEVLKIHALNTTTGKYEWIDLLGDQFVTSRHVQKLPGRQRGVNPEAMFQIIEDAYLQLRDELETASGLET